MNKLLSPLTDIDFSGSLAEITPYLMDQAILMTDHGWNQIYYLLADPEELTETVKILNQLNASILNTIYMNLEGGHDHYQLMRPFNCIVLPLEETGSVVELYSLPLGSPRYPDDPQRVYAEDCTLIKSESLDSPLLSGYGILDSQEFPDISLACSLKVPEGKVFKAILIFLNENDLNL